MVSTVFFISANDYHLKKKILIARYRDYNPDYSRLSLNGHLYKTNTSVKRTPRVGPCLSLLPLFDSL